MCENIRSDYTNYPIHGNIFHILIDGCDTNETDIQSSLQRNSY
jgi:hypothetical protein